MEIMRKNQCHYCREALGRTVFISAGHIFCTVEHAAFYRNEHNKKYVPQAEPQRAIRWLMYFLVAVFALLIIGLSSSAKAAVHCSEGVLCKDERVQFQNRSYICKDPLVALEIAKVHENEGLMKAKSYWDKATDDGHCIAYDNMDGVVGELVYDAKVIKVVSFYVEWPKMKVWLLTVLGWKVQLI